MNLDNLRTHKKIIVLLGFGSIIFILLIIVIITFTWFRETQLQPVPDNVIPVPNRTVSSIPSIEASPTVSASPETEDNEEVSWEVENCDELESGNAKVVVIKSSIGEQKEVNILPDIANIKISCSKISLSDKYFAILLRGSDWNNTVKIYDNTTQDLLYEKYEEYNNPGLTRFLFIEKDSVYYEMYSCPDGYCGLVFIRKINLLTKTYEDLNFVESIKYSPLSVKYGTKLVTITNINRCNTDRDICPMRKKIIIIDPIKEKLSFVNIKPDIYSYCPNYLMECPSNRPEFEIDKERNAIKIESHDDRCEDFKPEVLRGEDRTACTTEAEKMKRNRTILVSLETGEEILNNNF